MYFFIVVLGSVYEKINIWVYCKIPSVKIAVSSEYAWYGYKYAILITASVRSSLSLRLSTSIISSPPSFLKSF